jgi:hypothetical protein
MPTTRTILLVLVAVLLSAFIATLSVAVVIAADRSQCEDPMPYGPEQRC